MLAALPGRLVFDHLAQVPQPGGLGSPSYAVVRRLLDRGVLVRDVGIPHHLRVTAGTEPETTAFLTALEEVLGETGHRS